MDTTDIYDRLMNDDTINIETPECKEGVAYFTIEGVRYSAYWSEEWGIDEYTIEREAG